MAGAYMSMRTLYMALIMEEFSYQIKAGQIKDQPLEYHLSADATQRGALAKRFGLEAIAKLTGHFRLWHEQSGIIGAKLAMQADVTQICVVTLEPFEEHVAEVAELRFVPVSAIRRLTDESEGESEEDITPESFESPDEIFYENDLIDLGAALSEQLGLALSPYPRKPGATLPETAQDNSDHPFAGLVDKLGKKTC